MFLKKTQSLTIKDVMSRPIFKRAHIAAGLQGGHRQVRWVHVLEITNITPYLSRGDLILSTGLWLKIEQERKQYLMQLIQSEAAGLCVEFGTSIESIPQDVLELADEHQFPIIVFDRPVRFVEITQDIHSYIINRQHQLLKDLETYSRKVQQLTLQSTDISSILRLLSEYASQPVVYVSSLEHNRFYPSVSPERAAAIADVYAREVEHRPLGGQESNILAELSEDHYVLFQPVVIFGQVFSAVGIVTSEQPAEALSLLLDYTAKAVATLLLRTEFLEEKMLRNQNSILQDLLNNRIHSEEQAQTSMGLRLLVKGQYLFLGGVLEIEHRAKNIEQERKEANHQDMMVLLRSLLKKNNVPHLVMMKMNQIHVLCAKESLTKDTAVNLMMTLRSITEDISEFAVQLEGVIIHAGFGKVRQKMTESQVSFAEAYQVIEVSRSVDSMKDVLFYDKLGVYQLLKATPYTFLQSFVDDHLGVLVRYDEKHDLHLLDTLKAYMDYFGSKLETAKALYIHRQTLYNRLDKLEELLGEDWLAPHRRTSIEMALLAHDMLQHSQ
ncbi:PucR family transcriptional regulator [Paenibacillus sp. Marseille-Q4541]|uniref:PucR family transcriptional regulator n=1 Tax=Paenibacillus sp. Marseille-Q4541 TaxID=2831522 RepID=UPI00201A1A50|nr:PucR family transcriptional regulator [Paenibacillus sp. Marseille-Q4541]